MKAITGWLCVLAVAAGLVGGCSKKVEVAFVNTGQQPLELSMIDAPVHIAEQPITTMAPGSVYKRTFKLEKDDLPQAFSWTAMPQAGSAIQGTFTIDEESRDHYTVILPNGPFWQAGELEEYKRTRKVTSDPIPVGEPEMVVE